VKKASQVNVSVGETKVLFVNLLTKRSTKQEITRTLDSVEQMTKSIQEVANSARTAAVGHALLYQQRLERRQWISVQYLKVARYSCRSS